MDDENYPTERVARGRGVAREADRTGPWAIGITVLLAAAATGYWYTRERTERPAIPAPPAARQAPAEPAPAAAVQHPIEQAIADAPATVVADTPLPPLHESDPALLEALAALFGADALQAVLNPEFIAQRFVATVDNLTQQKLPPRLSPLKPVPGAFAVDAEGEATVVANANAARYDRHVALLRAVDTPSLVALYVRYYPLFQQAYDELGVPGRYFNDRLVEVIGHLLAAPAPAPPYGVTRARGAWEFADPRLEGLSAGHRAMLRLGPEHGATVRARLRELRDALTGQATLQPGRDAATDAQPDISPEG